jgi:hypothetical protein
MREELVEPGPRWEAALRYLGLPTTTQASPAALPDVVLAIVERLEQIEARLDAQNRPRV